MRTLDLPALWAAAGLHVVELAGWNTPRIIRDEPYVWRDGDPVCSMWHHTATDEYTPNRVKANVWAGLMIGDRLYQYGVGRPTLVVANAYPAPISSGYGQRAVIDMAERDTPNDAVATGPDDDPLWAANRSVWNTEIVLDGVGAWMNDDVWDMVTTAATIQHGHMGWSTHRAIGHAQFTSRKIDLRDGRDPSTYETMIRFRKDMTTQEEEAMYPFFGDTDTPTTRQYYIEQWQIVLAGLEGFDYHAGTTETVIELAGMTRGVYDEAMQALVAAHTDTNGIGIGPREAAQLTLDTRPHDHTYTVVIPEQTIAVPIPSQTIHANTEDSS